MSNNKTKKVSSKKPYTLDFVPGYGAVITVNLNNPNLTIAEICKLQDGLIGISNGNKKEIS